MGYKERHDMDSMISKLKYEKSSYFGPSHVCTKDNTIILGKNKEPFGDLSGGLSLPESKRLKKAAQLLYRECQYEIASECVDRLLYLYSEEFIREKFPNETKKSMEMLKDKFELGHISYTGKKIGINYYGLNLIFYSNAITFDNSMYELCVKLYLRCDKKEENVLAYNIADINFNIRKEK